MSPRAGGGPERREGGQKTRRGVDAVVRLANRLRTLTGAGPRYTVPTARHGQSNTRSR